MQIQYHQQTIHYWDKGDPDAPAVVMMHGNPETKESWQGVADLLATHNNNYRIIAPDFPGFGESDPFPPEHDIQPDGLIVFWDHFFQQLNLPGKMTIVAHDFGGWWLLPWASQNPDKVQAVIITNTTISQQYDWHFWAKIWQTPLLGELSMRFMNFPVFKQAMQKNQQPISDRCVEELYQRMHCTMQRQVLRFYRAYRQYQSKNPDQVAFFSRALDELLVNTPSKVLWGKKDPYLKTHLAEVFPVAPQYLEHEGHWHHISSPQYLADIIRQ